MSTGKASAIIAAGTMVSRVLGFVKMVLLAVAIGQSTSKAAEAFGMANQRCRTTSTRSSRAAS